MEATGVISRTLDDLTMHVSVIDDIDFVRTRGLLHPDELALRHSVCLFTDLYIAKQQNVWTGVFMTSSIHLR